MPYYFPDAASPVSISDLIRPEGFVCPCGRMHRAAPLSALEVGPGVLQKLPEMLDSLGIRKPYLVIGGFAMEACGKDVLDLLADRPYKLCTLPKLPRPLPNEEYLDRITEGFDPSCDMILGVGSGVINDLCKMLGKNTGLPTGIVGTAPSMDGYASNSAAMELGGIKTSVYTDCPTLILCDTLVLKDAPYDSLRSGLGDMSAKYMSIAEWKMAHLVTGEYYCDAIASLMMQATSAVMSNAEAIRSREEPAIRAMTEGLILSGIASSFAGVSRPASSLEHSISHLLEMFALAGGRRPALHGLQAAYGVRMGLVFYPQLLAQIPTRESCDEGFRHFDAAIWEKDMRRAFGNQADALIKQADVEGRNTEKAQRERSQRAIENWPLIARTLGEVASSANLITNALDRLEIPQAHEPELLGYTKQEALDAFFHSRDLRARYISSFLAWDLGILDTIRFPGLN
ncbi:MAG: iron-containing alcohol dehydrogenase [Firmicutes bacterium]|nr:iron-containing alcohol dehydrogenase [Bacillota bacterium]